MSRNVHDIVALAKGGRLLLKITDFSTPEEVVEITDVTEDQLSYLPNRFEIEDDVTIYDFFTLLSHKRDIYEEMFEQFYIKEYMAYVLDYVGDAVDNSSFVSDISALEVYYQIDCDVIDMETGFPDISSLSNVMPSFHGKSKPDAEDNIDYCVMYSDVREMFSTPLRLSKVMNIIIPKPDMPEGNGYHTFSFANPSYTLYNVIHAIMYELSWVGGPEEKKESLKRLNNLHDEYKDSIKDKDGGEKEI